MLYGDNGIYLVFSTAQFHQQALVVHMYHAWAHRPHIVRERCGWRQHTASGKMRICGHADLRIERVKCGQLLWIFSADVTGKMQMRMQIFLADHCRLQ